MSSALIAGYGYLGRALAAQLSADGVPVWGLRRGAAPGALPPGVRAVAADLGDRSALARALGPLLDEGEVDVFYLASPARPTDEAYQAVYVDGLVGLCAALGGRLRRLLLTTSTAVYGQEDGSWVDEASSAEPTSFAGRRLLEGERLAAELAPSAVAVRLGGIYGPERTSLVRRLLGGSAIAASDHPHYRNRIHRDDCVQLLRHLARLPSPHAVYLGVDDEPADLRRVQAWLCAQLGIDEARLGPAPTSPRGGNKRCSNARLIQAGVELAYPSYREGYQELVTGLRNNGAFSG